MKKKILYTAYALLFFSLCAIPAVCLPFVNADDSKENRQLSEFPKLMTEEGKINTNWTKEFDTYFSEHFAFRNKLVNINNTLLDDVFSVSGEDDVIKGKDGWLYYSKTIDDFLGTNQLEDWEIEDITHILKMMQEYAEKQGSSFIFACVPNKNTIYPEYMPYNYLERNKKSNLERLEENLSREKINFCSVETILKEQKENTPDMLLYHKTDTHWNNYGAYEVYKKLCEALSNEPIDISIKGTSNTREGDLQKMIFPDSENLDQQIDYDFEPTYSYVGRFRGLDDINIKTSCDGKEGSLLMFRDSFGEAILPYFAESDGSAVFSRAVPYKLNMAEGGNFDSIILEIVERNLKNLRKTAPEMPSPTSDEIRPTVTNTNLCSVLSEKNLNTTKIYGGFNEETEPEKIGRIYAVVNGVTYEAFPVFEEELLGQDAWGKKGYALNIADENISEAEIIAEINGEYISSGQITIKGNGD